MKKPVAKYTPRQSDIEWARGMIRLLAEGATMVFPSTQMIYRVSHKDKTITLQNEDQLLSFDSFVIHYQTIDTFREIGYTVLPGKQEEKKA